MSDIVHHRPGQAGAGFHLHDVLDAFPAAIYTTDADGYVVFYNRAAEELAGRTPELGRDKWCVAWKLFSPDGAPLPLDQCPMAIALKEGRAVRNVEVIAERPDGSRVPLMPFPTPLRDASGKLIGAVNMLVDISAMKNVEHAASLRADEQSALFVFTDKLYRARALDEVFEAALDAIFAALRCSRASILLFDGSGAMQFVAARGLSEPYKQAVTGHTPWALGDPDPRPIVVDNIEAAEELESLRPVIRGEGIGALAFIPLVANGGVIGKFMVYHDQPHQFGYSEIELALTLARQLGFAIERDRARDYRRWAEATRIKSEERYRAIVENSEDAIISKNLNSIVESWNKGAERVFGYTADEMIGQSITLLIPAENRDEEPGILERIRRGQRIEHYETVRRRKDGALIDISLTVSPVKDENGKIIGASKIARDITEQKRAEAQRTLLINELNHRVKNTLATVQSLAMQTLRSTERSADARALFDSRLSALSRAHDLLTAENWEGANLNAVVDRAMLPFRGNARISAHGPDVWLTPQQALALSIALHELATNAVKYGALSTASGAVEIDWRLEGARLSLDWVERGGPPVAPPLRTGFGTRLIERTLSYDLGGRARIVYRPEGVTAHIVASVGCANAK